MTMRIEPLRIDFSPPTLRRSIVTTSTLAWFLLLCAVFIGSTVSYRALNILHQHSENEVRLRHEAARVDAGMRRAGFTRQNHLPVETIKAINKVVEQLNLPWSELLDTLESLDFPNVAVLTLEPSPAKGMVLIQAEAKNAAQMIAFMEEVKATRLFKDAKIKSHEVYELDPNKPIRFQFEMPWLRGTR